MAKYVKLDELGKDKELVKQIEAYSKQKKTNFTEAVRQLCDKGLTVEKLKK